MSNGKAVLSRRRALRWALAASFAYGINMPAFAGEILVNGFESDSIGRFDSATKLHLGNLSGATLDGPQAVRLGPDQRLYVANEGGDNVFRYDARTKEFVDVFVSSGSGGLNGPTGLTFGPDGNLYVASFETDQVLRYDGTTGAFLGVFVSARSGGLDGPDIGIVFGPDEDLYVPSFWNNRVLKYNGATGASLGTFITGGVSICPQPRTIVFHNDDRVYVSSDSGNKVVRFNATTGAFVDNFVTAGLGGLSGASGMIFAADDMVYVTSWRNDRVLRYTLTGTFVDEFVSSGGPVNGPTFIMQLPDAIIPTVSEWGLASMGLLLLTAGSLLLRKPILSCGSARAGA